MESTIFYTPVSYSQESDRSVPVPTLNRVLKSWQGNVKLKCKRTAQRQKGESKEQGAAIGEQRAGIRGQRAESREQRAERTGQVAEQTIPSCSSSNASTNPEVFTELVPRGPGRWVYSPKENGWWALSTGSGR